MKVLVTGANGFLGRHVVAALLERGHSVRAMVRPASSIERLEWKDSEQVEFFRADLRVARDLVEAFDGVDALIHVAAAMGAGDFMLAGTAMSTERLFDAMAETPVKRLIQISSFSVYDWERMGSTADESGPLPADMYAYDNSYVMAKSWQERLARRFADEHGWELTFIRPGFVWGEGAEYQPCLGTKLGPVHVVFGGRRRLALTHVANCADAIAHALDDPRSIGQTYNVVDSDDVRAKQYVKDYIRGTGEGRLAVSIPSPLWGAIVKGVQLGSRVLFQGQGKLPSIFNPDQYALRFKPFRYSNAALREGLGWSPPLSYEACKARTYEGA